LPDVPTMQEAGYSGFDTGSWQGIFVPAGTPPEVIQRLFVALRETMKSPDVIERLGRGGVDVVVSDSPRRSHRSSAGVATLGEGGEGSRRDGRLNGDAERRRGGAGVVGTDCWMLLLNSPRFTSSAPST
jgi:hypothetical protein